MDRLANYRQILADYILKQADVPYPDSSKLRHIAVIDQERDHYLLLTLGQQKNGDKVNATDIYLSIQNDKVLLIEANIDWNIFEDLEEAGIQREDIIDATQTLEAVN